MMRSLPLGVDIGATRLRLVHTVVTEDGPKLRAVATRDLAQDVATSGIIIDQEYVAAAIEEAYEELQTAERRCVLSVGEPDAVLRSVEFPKMTEMERGRAAVFEAQRYIDYSIEEALVRMHPVEERTEVYAIGVIRAKVLHSRIATIKAAGLRPLAADHEGLALGRALPGYDAILDIGHERTSIHIYAGSAPLTLQHVAGGAEITRGIERDLAVDARSAEKRKRILGTAGAGESARSAFLADITSLLETASSRTGVLARVALFGNGCRLNNFAVDLERATGLLVETPASKLLRGDAYPTDVVRAGAADWNLAAGLATWGLSAA
ncbi:MAG: pilus assembly protein PilM [Candidatus Eremiobacteraeota bacterium]|nr:pilus assembly protein PilM [Candidatus Eremiobacteraeota bacterium]